MESSYAKRGRKPPLDSPLKTQICAAGDFPCDARVNATQRSRTSTSGRGTNIATPRNAPIVNRRKEPPMTRVAAKTARTFVGSVLCVLVLAAPTQAEPITLNFSGTVDLSSEGGPAVNVFGGSLTWNSNALPFDTEPGSAAYDLLSYTLFFNGADVSEPVIGDGTGSGFVVGNDVDLLQTGNLVDSFAFFMEFDIPFPLATTGEKELILVAQLIGPPGMFNSTAPPGNLNFLKQLTSAVSLWMADPDSSEEFFLDLQGTLEVSAPPTIPEPVTLAMLRVGVVGALMRARNARLMRRPPGV